MTDERVERAFQGHERIDREALARYREKPWGHDMAPINLTTLRRLIGTIDALEEIASMSTPDGELEGRARDSAIEECAKVCEQQAQDFLSPEYATPQPIGSLMERFACTECASAIRALKGKPTPVEGE